MASANTIHLLIIHQSEEEAERILSLLRNYQIAVRPSRCINEDELVGLIERKPIDLVLCQQVQEDLPLQTVVDQIKRIGKDIPVIALIDTLDNDAVSESLDSGAANFCTHKLPEYLKSVVLKEKDALHTRRKFRQQEVELHNTEKRCSALLDTSKQAIAYIHEGMHVYSNQSYQELFGYEDMEELEITPFLNLVAKDDLDKAKTVLRNISKNILPDEDLKLMLIGADQEEFEASVTINKATIDGEPCAQFLIQQPSSNPEAEKELFEIKNKDLLTKYFNRAYYQNHLSDAIASTKAKQKAGDSILYLQIDHVDNLIKELGQGGLDLMIGNLAQLIRSKLGEKVFYARYAETGFIIQLKAPIEKAEQVAKKLQDIVSHEIISAGERSTNITLSIAVTQITEQSESANQVIKTLTDQIETLVSEGGNSVAVFDPAEEEKRARAASQQWIDKIDDAIKNNKFVLHYQPIINLHGDNKEHYEVFIRLREGDKIVPPNEFIPIAIKYGFIKEIDHWVVKNAIESAKGKDVHLLLKLSSPSLVDPGFPNWIAETIRKSGISGDRLIFEIPESELITNAKSMKPVVRSIKELHCSFLVEKFGSGLNSFTILKHFPVDYLKIDPQFTRDLADSKENQDKIKDIIDKAHAQGKQVICEFVEDANTMSILWKLSVNLVQGNFIAPAGEKMETVE